ncbi:2-C-methyl-D-erythritol 4-phosphate cytidylyltransferase [Comamonas sp. NLF-1-9]|uniref:2-C-methyl-D-erythritol 4-phosphate cytidylyltransferase n=1 Tax=Comamonas sp. NLF-1-9 TaxID=2853163 RepID=UPI001C46DCB2|nr:2-C-methyl-D-erythritol 4-phosphate cytidylyltransferase [Comamonas sp. NLF-1-9]QXL85411.1 2-C-methyl-D-erythritol 4-phosphate cytidylyltransferase [Comamonas sp. NLF-1-9]
MADAARLIALVPCAGSGSRAGAGRPKQYQSVAGRPLVEHTLAALAAVQRIERTLVVVAPGDEHLACTPRQEIARCGGATRAESVCNGLQHLLAHGAGAADWVLVHDAARCLITPALVDALIDACLPDAVGGLLALPLPDTLKVARADRAVQTLERGDKWLAQTPQMFRLGTLLAALEAHRAAGFAGITDEASAMELAGHTPLLVRGSLLNLKITWPQDFALAEAVLKGYAR